MSNECYIRQARRALFASSFCIARRGICVYLRNRTVRIGAAHRNTES
jgi:hypothetical protein